MSGEAGEPVKKVISWDELQERAKNDNKVHIHKDDSTLTYNSMNSPILFRWWDELPPSGIEKNKVFDRERLFD